MTRHPSIILIMSLALASHSAMAQPAQDAAYPWEGEVTGSNVFVRSGAGNNWYPTTKLNAGDRVLVLGEKFGWYQIAPPSGSFSYIDMSMVERQGNAKTGVVKQDKVYVRAGSKLEQRRNSTQVVLNKGDTIDIIGESDGFFKINPPPGATLFISRQYIRPVDATLRSGLVEQHVSTKGASPTAPNTETPGGKSSATTPTDGQKGDTSLAANDPNRIPVPMEDVTEEQPQTSEPSADQPTTGELHTDFAAAKTPDKPQKPAAKGDSKSSQTARHEPASTTPPTTGRYKAMLTMVEGELANMMRRPLEEQNPLELVKRYEPIAAQREEPIPSQVAAIRIRQLRDRASLKESHIALAKDSREIDELRANMDKERVRIMNQRVLKAMERYDLEGELRESFAFASENRRYRLVDPQSKVTIAYVDIPASVQTNPQHLIGQLVGIKTSGKRFSPAARVPIAVAEEVVDLSPRKIPEGGLPMPATTEESGDDAGDTNTSGEAHPSANAGDQAEPNP